MKKQRYFRMLATFCTIVLIAIVVLLTLKIQYILFHKENYTVTVLEKGDPVAIIYKDCKEVTTYEILGEKEIPNHGEIIFNYIVGSMVLLFFPIFFLVYAIVELLYIKEEEVVRKAAKYFYFKRKQYHKEMLKYKNR